MILSTHEARVLSQTALTSHGLEEEEARIVSGVLVEAELRGRPTHGLMRIPSIVRRRKGKRPAPMHILKERGACVFLDGGDHLGYVVAHRCAEIAIDGVKKRGMALVGANNLGHTGMMGYYVSMMAEQGIIGIGVCDCFPKMVPWGGMEPVFGTNPISVGIPFEPHPILVDLSTAAVTIGDIRLAGKRGGKLPEGLALDAQGHFTDDPGQVHGVLPFGEHKGSALALVVQVLTTALVGAAVIPEGGKDYGLLIIGIAPGLFVDSAGFDESVSALAHTIKSSRRMPGVKEILIPGERAFRERERRLREGIEVEDALVEEIKSLRFQGGHTPSEH